jgi:hypothetical protein
MGDVFTPDPPAAVKQMVADAEAEAESYIAGYNIMMGIWLLKMAESFFRRIWSCSATGI